MDLVAEARGTARLVALAATASCVSFDSACSIRSYCSRIRFVQSYRVNRIQRLSVAARFSQPAQGFIPIAYVTFLINVAETYLFLFDEAGEANAMRLAFSFACWFFLLLAAHNLINPVHC